METVYMYLYIFLAAEDSIQVGKTSKNCITPSSKWEQVKVTVSDLGYHNYVMLVIRDAT